MQLRIVECFYPTLAAGLANGSIDFYVGPQATGPLPGLLQEFLLANTRIILGRRGHPLSGAKRLSDLAGAEWATTSITDQAQEEMGELFERNGLKPPSLAMQSQSALTLLIAQANSELLAIVPVQ